MHSNSNIKSLSLSGQEFVSRFEPQTSRSKDERVAKHFSIFQIMAGHVTTPPSETCLEKVFGQNIGKSIQCILTKFELYLFCSF